MNAVKPILRWAVRLEAAALALFPAVSGADQCAWVEPAVAEKAAALIRESRAVVEWCQPCGESRPAEPANVSSVEVRPTEERAYREVYVNGKAVDLAYLYVQSGTDTFRNVSKVVGCESSGVSSELRLNANGQATPLTGKAKTLVGILQGVEEGEHARRILRSDKKRLELRPGKDLRGRCRDALGSEVRVSYTEEPSPDEPSGDIMVVHSLEVLRRNAGP
jgi:hypothetical protein